MAIYLAIILSLLKGISSKDNILKLDIPENHGTQQLYEAFKVQPKEEHIADRVADLVVRAGSEESRHEVDPFTAQCVHDFSLPCPESWTKNGSICEAPLSYKGDCEGSVDTTNFTTEQKMLFMNDCQVRWPCKKTVDKTDTSYCKSSDRNFLQPCPDNFLRHKQESGYVCVPDVSVYTGPCTGIVDFANYSKESKMLWAQTCGTTWPCMTVCPMVFERCPMDWTITPSGACEAPASYKGPCERLLHFTYYTQDMKRKKCIECDIPFECSISCRKDYDKCPVMWKSDTDGYCSPPSGTLSCRDVLMDLFKQSKQPETSVVRGPFDFRLLDLESKKLFESKCNNVEFPCEENDEGINWSLSCPSGWTIDKDDLRSCHHPQEDDNDICKSQVTFNNEEDKRAFASRCQIKWSGSAKHISPVKTSGTGNYSGPINDLGSVHRLERNVLLSAGRMNGNAARSRRGQSEPKENSVSVKHAADTPLPYIVKAKEDNKRKNYKGFLREMHLLSGST